LQYLIIGCVVQGLASRLLIVADWKKSNNNIREATKKAVFCNNGRKPDELEE